jgi:hypothetical protein
MFADTESACGAVPLAGATLSQVLSLVAVNVRVPPPVFVTFTLPGAGFVPPAVAVKETVWGETDRVAGIADPLKLTPVMFAPLIVTGRFAGVNEYPERLGVTV